MLEFKSDRRVHLLPDSRDILPLCFVELTAFSFFSFLLILFLSFRVNQLAERKTTFVQLVNGRSIVVSERDYLDRRPEVVQDTVRQWANLTFNWDGTIPGTKELDRGHDVGNGKLVTTNAYFGSFLIQPGPRGFRQAALKALADITPTKVFSGQVRSKLIVSYLSTLRTTRSGEWEVDLVATRVLVNLAGGADEEIPFNRTFTLKAVDLPSPLSADASPLDRQLYELQSSGLEIAKIAELTPQ